MCLGVATAATVDCDTQGTSIGPRTILFTYSQWATDPQMTGSDGCLQEDKIFSNFDPGAAPTDTVMALTLQHDPITGGDIHTVVFLDDFAFPFTIKYTVRVDTSVTNEVIWKVTGDILNTAAQDDPSLNKRLCDSPIPGTCAGSTFDANDTASAAAGPLSILVPNLQKLNVTDAYTTVGGVGAEGFSNAFYQVTGVPEPGTTALLGGGLLLLGFVSRRRRTV